MLVGEPTRHSVTPPGPGSRKKVAKAFLDAPELVRVALRRAVAPESLPAEQARLLVGDRPHRIAKVEPKPGSRGHSRQYQLWLADPLDVDQVVAPLTLELPGHDPAPVAPRDALVHEAFTPLHVHLGPSCTAEATTFRTWSPTAQQVDLLLYDSPGAAAPARVVELDAGEQGLWEIRIPGDLHGMAYQYRFHPVIADHAMHPGGHPGGHPGARSVSDVHAFAATADSQRSIVVDLRRTDPPGFRDPQQHPIPRIEHAVDEVIYEIHVRDFSIRDPHIPAAHRGRYLGLLHKTDAQTSLAHLQRLGVTTVHLLPVQDFPGHELEDYHWGYWTELFNVPESRYATDALDPLCPIVELKRMIHELHRAGIRVVLDVVYNHTASSFAASPFDQTVPWYYFRTHADGTLRNDAGVGNAVADERPMVRKYILDSLRYWVQEYQVDGFRFDLMGMHHRETMELLECELRRLRPDILLYGEPWTGGGPIHFPKGAQRRMKLAVFNDHLRNALRGDLDGNAQGFITNGSHREAVMRGIAGSIDDFTDAPSETINYVSAHDNRTLHDKIAHTLPHATDAQRQAIQKLALAIVLTSQGIPFLHGGCDFLRTKNGHHNTYNAGDDLNAFDWQRRDQYRDVVDYTAGLIALRKAHPAFRLRSAEQVRQLLRFLDTGNDLIAYTLDGQAAGDPWHTILVALNGQTEEKSLRLPEGQWSVAVDATSAGTTPLRNMRHQVHLPAHSMMVLFQSPGRKATP